MEINSSTAKKCPFLKVTKDEIKLNRSHKYYTQVVSQMALTEADECFFVVWTSKLLLVEIIKFDLNHWSRVETNLELFYKCYVCPAILFITPITFCAKCDKPVFQEKELLPKEQNTLSKVQCADCCCWYHKQCTGVHLSLIHI